MNLHTYFYTEDGVVKALNGVNLEIKSGEVLGLVGESGCGKSVTALSILRLIQDPPGKIVQGEIWFEGENLLQYPSGAHAPGDPWRQDCHDLPGSDDLAQPGVSGRGADRRGD